MTVDHLRRVVEDSAIAAVEAGERHSGSEIFEAGVDLIVDDAGTAWVLELNGRPGRYGLKKLSIYAETTALKMKYAAERRSALARILRYAQQS